MSEHSENLESGGEMYDHPLRVAVFDLRNKIYFFRQRQIFHRPFFMSSVTTGQYLVSRGRILQDGLAHYFLNTELAFQSFLERYLLISQEKKALHLPMP